MHYHSSTFISRIDSRRADHRRGYGADRCIINNFIFRALFVALHLRANLIMKYGGSVEESVPVGVTKGGGGEGTGGEGGGWGGGGGGAQRGGVPPGGGGGGGGGVTNGIGVPRVRPDDGCCWPGWPSGAVPAAVHTAMKSVHVQRGGSFQPALFPSWTPNNSFPSRPSCPPQHFFLGMCVCECVCVCVCVRACVLECV